MIRLLTVAIALLAVLASAAQAEPLTVFSYGEFYPTKASAPRLDFTKSRFNMAVSNAVECACPQRFHDVAFAADYIYDIKYNANADNVVLLADQIVSGWERGKAEYGGDIDLELFLAVARYESSFDPTANNLTSRAHGLYQFLPRYHESRMTEGMALDWNSAADQTTYAYWHLQHDIDKGQSLYRASAWWTVRPKAWPEYQRLLKVRASE